MMWSGEKKKKKNPSGNNKPLLYQKCYTSLSCLQFYSGEEHLLSWENNKLGLQFLTAPQVTCVNLISHLIRFNVSLGLLFSGAAPSLQRAQTWKYTHPS